jgi:low temperature requirement protein LtrA
VTATGWRRPLVPRDWNQPHRASTPLELLFDLCFVVAVAQAGNQLHHAVADGHAGRGALGYLMVLFAVWWAWMNFSWFASGYDNDDLAYRLFTFVQIAGGLILAAGVPAAMDGYHFGTVTVGYVVMRVAMISQWLRVAVENPETRVQGIRYAAGYGLAQVGWLIRLALPGTAAFVAFFVLAAAELAVPVFAERRSTGGGWHPEHIAERYGLFTLIVLGESVAAATVAVQEAASGGIPVPLAWLAAGALGLVGGLWWVYFDHPAGDALRATPRLSFLWGYGHYAVFAGLAAVGAGLQVAADAVGHGDRGRTAGLAVAIPVALYLVVTALLQSFLRYPHDVRWLVATSGTAAVVLLIAALIPVPAVAVPLAGLAVAGLVTYHVFRTRSRDPFRERPAL